MSKPTIAIEEFITSDSKGIRNLFEDRRDTIQQAINNLRAGTLTRGHVFSAQWSAETLASQTLGALMYLDHQDAELARLYSAATQFVEAMRCAGFNSRDYAADNSNDVADHDSVWEAFE